MDKEYLYKFLTVSAIAGSLYYMYKEFIKGESDPYKKFINEYIGEIKKMISKNKDWKFDMNLLCHLNFIIDEISSNQNESKEKVINDVLINEYEIDVRDIKMILNDNLINSTYVKRALIKKALFTFFAVQSA